MSWQPIESAPRDGKPLLLWSKSRGVQRSDGAFSGGEWCVGPATPWMRATHWMPQPDPPQISETDDRWELTEAGRAMRGGK